MVAIEGLNGEKIVLEYKMFFKKRTNLLTLIVILKQKNYIINYIYKFEAKEENV